MELTRTQQRRLAREARNLAYECAAGAAPKMDPSAWGHCAMAIVVRRSGVRPEGDDDYTQYFQWPANVTVHLDRWARRVGFGAGRWTGLCAVGEALHDGGPQAVEFPLLALADELDSFSEQPPAGPSSALPAVLSDSTEEEK